MESPVSTQQKKREGLPLTPALLPDVAPGSIHDFELSHA